MPIARAIALSLADGSLPERSVKAVGTVDDDDTSA
jgi:hypothetical protein